MCDSSDDEERLAAQRLFRNYLVQSDRTAVADVRIQGAVDELPPSFPERESLELLGSAFTDTENTRELIFGWQSTEEDADDLYLWYRSQLDVRAVVGRVGPAARQHRLHQVPRCGQSVLPRRAADLAGGRPGDRDSDYHGGPTASRRDLAA